ncbi:hypothetical protein LRP30_13465 [Bradyrhizobium sp. C-145]|uniref:hypothetical protein n=1 Tax=Bradyrhizobium sp. C-145 TaxID=574727 RepID=UPI00201B815C|nr:hypothetical protein [Bradyrhizobium sp. C-145]UQR66194.1 hypothetical protein LRP30_13465 [Bradyrhizobium sp. C-145]
MIEVNFDTADFTGRAMELGAVADQLPYILARSLNDAAEKTRSYLIERTWPTAISAKNRSFIGAALTARGARATKQDLRVEIYDKLGRGNLMLHAKGGTRRAKGANLAIPSSANVKRTASGAVSRGQTPRALADKAARRGRFLFAKGKMVYTLDPAVQIKRDVPFYRDFTNTMRQAVLESLPRNVAIAMSTRRSR